MEPVLVVDLDGTLIHSDLLVESALSAGRQHIADLFAMPGWLMQGKAVLKHKLAEKAQIEVPTLPWNLPLLNWLQVQRDAGRRLVLATASDIRYAEQIAQHLGCFESVLATQNGHNLSGEAKRAALVERFGEQGYDYVGDSKADLAVWRSARKAITVNMPVRLTRRIPVPVEKSFAAPAGQQRLRAWARALRLHQWLKNLLLFLPLLAAHDFRIADWLRTLAGFIVFGTCASSVYLLNDFIDLNSDRHHARKRLRPFASGQLPIVHGMLLWPCLFGAAAAGSWLLSTSFAVMLALYYLITTGYSLLFKRIAMLDVLTLAGLYTVRIVAGASLNAIVPSFWLLCFAMFFFLSLAFLKRYAELVDLRQRKKHKARGRDYQADDAPLIATQGITTGCLAVLVLAFYINSQDVWALYHEPRWLWGICIVVLYWLNRSWWLAHRGRLHDDPVIYAITDHGSRLMLLLTLALVALASMSH